MNDRLDDARLASDDLHAKVVARLVEAERRLALAREALEQICEAFGHTEQELKDLARAALDGEGES